MDTLLIWVDSITPSKPTIVGQDTLHFQKSLAWSCVHWSHRSEFPESLVSDSKFWDSRLKTQIRTRIRPRYFSIQSLGIGIEVQGIADLKEENVIIYGFLKGKKQNRTQNSKTLGSGLGLGIGLGIRIATSLYTGSRTPNRTRNSDL